MPFSLAYRYDRGDDWKPNSDFFFLEKSEAGAKVKELNQRATSMDSNIRYKVIPILPGHPDSWKERVQKRFDSGEWKKPPFTDYWTRWSSEHIHTEDPSKIAFYMSSDDAIEDKLTVMNPGKYYLRYINNCVDHNFIDEICANMGIDTTVSPLQIATTAEDIVNVYLNGPHSCMAYEIGSDQYSIKGHHPCEVYAAGDLAVAYITRGEEITARSLIWPEKKTYGRVYGDKKRLIMRLKEAGYSEDWDISGARLLLKKDPNGCIIAPYIDADDMGGIIEGDYIRLSDRPHLILKSPDGCPDATECAECGAHGVYLLWNDDNDGYFCEDHW